MTSVLIIIYKIYIIVLKHVLLHINIIIPLLVEPNVFHLVVKHNINMLKIIIVLKNVIMKMIMQHGQVMVFVIIVVIGIKMDKQKYVQFNVFHQTNINTPTHKM